MFEDDDELFMNLEFDGDKLNVSSGASTSVHSKAETKKPRITTTTRVKYENSSSDEEPSSSSKSNGNRPQTSVPEPPKPIGIRKRNIF